MALTETRELSPFFSGSQISVKTVLWAMGTALVVLSALWMIRRAGFSLGVTVASFVLAISIDHLVKWLEAHHWNRGLAIAAIMGGLVLLFLAFAFLIVPTAVHQGAALGSGTRDFVERIHHSSTYSALDARFHLSDELAELPHHASSLAVGALAVVSNVALIVGSALTIFFLTIFMLVFGPDMVRHMLSDARRSRRPYYERIINRVYDSLGGYILGVSLIGLLNTAVFSLFLALIGVPYFLPLGVLSGLLNLIPNIGALVAFVLMALVTVFSGGVWKLLAFVIFFLVFKQIENYVIGPLVLKKTAAINPLTSTIVVLVMSEIAGIRGALVAIPALASVQVVLGEVMAIRREWLQREEPEDAPESARSVPPGSAPSS